jgi:hypothetical protein
VLSSPRLHVYGDEWVFKKQFPAFLLAFVLPILAVYWWWGGFAPVTVAETDTAPTRYAYLAYDGPIDNMRKTQNKALEKFKQAGVAAGDTFAVILTDPRATQGKVKAHLGYTLAASAAVPEGLTEGRIERRAARTASVQAAILLAPSKAYQALSDRYGEAAIKMPTVERYRPAGHVGGTGVFTLEVPR